MVLGIGTDIGSPRNINPSSRWHLENGTYPTSEDIQREINGFKTVLESEGVQVLRPENLPKLDQIFARDIGFTIEDRFVVANMKKEVRKREFQGIHHLVDQMLPDKVLKVPEGATVEGGDVILWNEHIFVGISDRTNHAGFEFIKEQFPEKQVHAIDLVVSENRSENILHLDCAFQPIGTNEAIIFQEGFKQWPNVISDLFAEANLVKVNRDQKNRMFPNVFSISPTKIVIERGFAELKEILIDRGFEVFEVDYSETSKLSGLLRCSTLPLRRSEN